MSGTGIKDQVSEQKMLQCSYHVGNAKGLRSSVPGRGGRDPHIRFLLAHSCLYFLLLSPFNWKHSWFKWKTGHPGCPFTRFLSCRCNMPTRCPLFVSLNLQACASAHGALPTPYANEVAREMSIHHGDAPFLPPISLTKHEFKDQIDRFSR